MGKRKKRSQLAKDVAKIESDVERRQREEHEQELVDYVNTENSASGCASDYLMCEAATNLDGLVIEWED